VEDDYLIRLRNAVFYAYHGAASDEQRIGGKFEVDVDLHVNVAGTSMNDDLRQTVDYEKVYECVERVVHSRKYYLIESLAAKIADEILSSFEQVGKVLVRVRKPSAPVKGVVDCVEVEIAKARTANG
jgi:dihydroneopterin aldolase